MQRIGIAVIWIAAFGGWLSCSSHSVTSGAGPAPILGGELDPPSNGGTITFQDIGAPGWFPSRRDPASGPCDAYQSTGCCLTRYQVSSDQLTPWDEDLILTLRGPLLVKQLVVYQPDANGWRLVSNWDSRSPANPTGIAFDGKSNGNTGAGAGFDGAVGSECLVDVSTDRSFACGSGSVPYCPPPPGGQQRHAGWSGSKLFVMLAMMPHAGSGKTATQCSQGNGGGWYDASWIGLNPGELVRAGSFASCNCFAKDPAKWWLADGCGQFNVFEVVNDNNQYKNLDVFSTNLIGYGGYVGEGPCGASCNADAFPPAADLIDKRTSAEAAAGAIATPGKGPGAAFRRPEAGFRYFVIAMDAGTRTIQLAIVHPGRIPAALAPLLPDLPGTISRATVDALVALRLPK